MNFLINCNGFNIIPRVTRLFLNCSPFPQQASSIKSLSPYCNVWKSCALPEREEMVISFHFHASDERLYWLLQRWKAIGYLRCGKSQEPPVLKISKDSRFSLEEIGLSLLVIGTLIVSNFGIHLCYCNTEAACFSNG